MVINQLGVSPNLLRQPASQAQGGGPGLGSQDKGPDFSVNGRAQPLVEMAPGEVQMWRIANTSGRSGAYFGGFQRGFQWRQLAQDGVQFTYDNYEESANKPFLMAAGNRVDLLVKAPLIAGKYNVTVQHEVDPTDLPKANQVTLIQVSVTGQPAKGRLSEFIDRERFPRQPRFLTNITDAEVTGGTGDGGPVGTVANPRVITFASTPPSFTATPTPGQTYGMHTINGQKFDENNPKDVIPLTLGTVEEWKIVNASYGPLISHPFHIHINPFQILEVFSPNEQVVTSKGLTVPKYVFYDDPKPDDAAVLSQSERPHDLEGLQERRRSDQTAHLVGRVSDPLGHRRDRCEQQAHQRCLGKPDHGAGLFPHAQPVRRLCGPVRAALSHPGA